MVSRMFRFFELPGLRRAAAVLAMGVASAPMWVQADNLLLLRCDGAVSDFASLGDLRPAKPVDATPLSAVRPAVAATRPMPVEPFTHLKSAVPLLVGDLNVQSSVALIRPMVGRSVGAVPQREWSLPVSGR